jgi:hypothetical protein
MELLTEFRKKKISVYLHKMFPKLEDKPVITDMQRKSLSIFRKIVANPDSTLMVDPLTSCCYVKYKHYFIKLDKNSILMKNMVISNYTEMDYRVGEKAKMFFFKHVSKRRIEMENKYDANILKNLDEINFELINIKN